MTKAKKWFRKGLMEWFADHHRPMPWKGEKNPYLVWLSEIILQQTRVEQGLAYYERFKERFPTIVDLANAPEDDVMKLWEGLGYYSRARNLHATAKLVTERYKGIFPNNYPDILSLKGVGPYTAAAIASFAFGLPHAVVDGNVYRVLSRYFGIQTPIDSTAGKKQFAKLASELLIHEEPDQYNQAIIDFGATHCRPKKPLCTSCVMKTQCVAFNENLIDLLPFKEKKIKKRTRYFHYFLLNFEGQILIHKRLAKDIWQHLYDFPLLEQEAILGRDHLLFDEKWQEKIGVVGQFNISRVSKPFQQVLTHQKIIATFWELNAEKPLKYDQEQYLLVERNQVKNYAFPKVIDCYLQDNLLYLELF